MGIDSFKNSKVNNRKYLRSNLTSAESMLWLLLRERQILGARFRRQHPFGKFILDFYCPRLKLCIEVDGFLHNFKSRKLKDLKRNEFLEKNGISLLRFKNSDVLKYPENVVDMISARIMELNNQKIL